MSPKLQWFLFLIAYALFSLCSCGKVNPASPYAWNIPFSSMGSLSSPRCVDLNQDGILDVVIGAGMNEFFECDQGVIALNGKDGKILWTVPTTDQIVGSPTFIQLTEDTITDIVIGGRSKNLMAIDGKNGKVLWKYAVQSNDKDPKAYARFNWFNCQALDDVNGDHIADILAANGGNPQAKPHSMIGRHPGTLMILDGKSGNILAIDTMPDGLENYCSPILKREGNKKYIVYGTGGETFGGDFFKADLEDLKHNNLKKSIRLAHNAGQGFIAPAVLADLNGDKNEEVIVSSHDGNIYAIDGNTNMVLWHRSMPGLECNNDLVPGYFDSDSTLDFFGFFTKGSWPENNGIEEFVLNGKDGSVLYRDSIGYIGFSSPVSFQADNDRQNEVLIHINYDTGKGDYSKNRSQLILYDFPGFKKIDVDESHDLKNISTTPWVGDLDQDGKMDVITCYLKNTRKADEVMGMFISRLKSGWPAGIPIWGGYMGTYGDGSCAGRN